MNQPLHPSCLRVPAAPLSSTASSKECQTACWLAHKQACRLTPPPSLSGVRLRVKPESKKYNGYDSDSESYEESSNAVETEYSAQKIVYVKLEHSTAGGGTTEVGTVQIQVIDIAMTNRNGGFFECVDEYARELGQLALYFDAYGRLQPNRGCWQPRDFKNERHLVYIQELVIEPAWRGKGLGAWVLRTLLNLPALQGARYLFTWPTVLLRFEPMSANGPFGDPTPTEQAAFLKKRDGIIQFYRKVGFRRLANGHFFCWAKNRSHASHAISIEEDAPFEELPPPTTEEEAHRRYMANQ